MIRNNYFQDNKKPSSPKKRAISPLSMKSFSNPQSCLKSFSKNSFCSKSFSEQDEKKTVIVSMSTQLRSLEVNRGFWPTSSEVSGNGRLREISVDNDEYDDLVNLVEKHGGFIQED